MAKLSLMIAVICTVAGCNDKKKQQQKTPEQGSAVQDPKWVERLAEVDQPSKLSLEMTAGLVGIKADGSIVVDKPPGAGAAPLAGARAVKVEELVSALGITRVAPRSDSFATLEGSGDAGGENHFAQLAHPAQASGAPAPAKRATSVFATMHPHDVTAGVIVFADARAPAGVLIDVLTQTGGFLAVRRGAELGALPLAFDRQAPPAVAADKSWFELRVGKPIEIETVPSKPAQVDSIDKLAEAVKDATAVDVLVGPDTTVQELVTAIGKLRATKVDAIGFGRVPAPGSPEAATRGEHGPRVIAWDFNLQGQADAATLRAAFDGALEPMRACYTNALAKQKDLAGTAQLQFLVTEKSGVTTTEVVAVPPVLKGCVTTAVKAAKYPSNSVANVIVVARIAFMPR